MIKIFIFFFLPLVSCDQQPLLKIYAYSQATVSGIPDHKQDSAINRLPKKYFIYAEVKKGTMLSVEGLWLNGKYYTVTTVKKVVTPVVLSNTAVPTKEKDTLVKKTNNDVYSIAPGEKANRHTIGAEEQKLGQENQLVIVFKNKDKSYFGTAKVIKELAPVAGM